MNEGRRRHSGGWASRRARLATWAFGLVLLAMTSLAQAQAAPHDGFRLDRYLTPPTRHDGFALALPSVLPHLTPSAQLMARYALAPLVLKTPDSEQAVVQHQLGFDLVAALGLFDAVEIYARLPVTLITTGGDVLLDLTTFQTPSSPAVGDMALGATARLLARRHFALGARAEALLPSGSLAKLTSDGAVEPFGELLAAYDVGRLTLAASAGGMWRADRDYATARIGPEVRWGAAVRVHIDSTFDALIESVGTVGLRDRDAPGASDGVELSVGARRHVTMGEANVSFGAALGAGLSDLIGEPALRMLGQLAVEGRSHAGAAPRAQPPVADEDGDRVADEDDSCPEQAEDLDGFEDADGCPDLDDDGDSVPDASDACPREPGASRTGCPTDDLDEDGVPDVRDPCPRDPEDLDGDRDEDGCPDLDSDGDGITDDRDACPDVPGLREKQGCLAHAKLERDRIVLLTPIMFDDQNVWLDMSSRPVLDDVAALLKARPRLNAELVVHVVPRSAPDRGETTASAHLSLLYEALVARGIDRTRLSGSVRLDADGADRVEILLRVPPAVPPAPKLPSRSAP